MTAQARIGPAGVQNDRQAVMNEAYYAISGKQYFYPSANTGQWNYLASDPAAYWHTRDYWTTRYAPDGIMTHPNDPKMRELFLAGDLPSYGFYGGIGRGAQCKYFANLLLYRAGVANVDPMPSYNAMQTNSRSSRFAKSGDVLFIANFHTAIVTQVLSGSSSAGTVTKVEVVDSNWVGGEDNEIIGKHVYSGETLAKYRVWMGVPYYKC